MGLGRKLHNLLHPAIGRVLMLHRVVEHIGSQPEARVLEVTRDFFAKSLDALQKEGVDFITIDQVAKQLKEKKHKPFVCITFDDGYLDTYLLAYPILKERKIPFCAYMTRDFYLCQAKPHWNPNVEMMGVDQLLELSTDSLCTIGVHTCTHPHLSGLSYEEQLREIEMCKVDLERLLGKTVCHLAYPYGDYNLDSLRIVRDLGFKTAVTTSGRPVRDDVRMFEIDRVTFVQPE